MSTAATSSIHLKLLRRLAAGFPIECNFIKHSSIIRTTTRRRRRRRICAFRLLRGFYISVSTVFYYRQFLFSFVFDDDVIEEPPLPRFFTVISPPPVKGAHQITGGEANRTKVVEEIVVKYFLLAIDKGNSCTTVQ